MAEFRIGRIKLSPSPRRTRDRVLVGHQRDTETSGKDRDPELNVGAVSIPVVTVACRYRLTTDQYVESNKMLLVK
jgi:hypothetical protein